MITCLIARDEEKKWDYNNPVLKDKELVCVYTLFGPRYKLGDGIHTYQMLPFIDRLTDVSEFIIYDADRSKQPVITINLRPFQEDFRV